MNFNKESVSHMQIQSGEQGDLGLMKAKMSSRSRTAGSVVQFLGLAGHMLKYP